MPKIINGVEVPHFDVERITEALDVRYIDIIQMVYQLGYLDGYDAGADE